MTLVMYDSIDIFQIPADAAVVAGYVDGLWPTYTALRARFPHARPLSITVSAAADADCLDVENGDATPGQASGWIKRQLARKLHRPVIYANASTLPGVLQALSAAGIRRASVRLWSAHYDGPHICGPATCRYPGVPACDGTQWTSNALGLDLDESLLLADFFASKPKPPKPRRHEPVQLPQVLSYVTVSIPAGTGHVVLSVGANAAPLKYQFLPGGTWTPLTLVAQDGASVVAVPAKATQIRVQRSETAESIDVALQDS